jgi:hypothetical protein
MRFVDYDFDLGPDGSIFMDETLRPAMIEVKEGDIFVATVYNDKVLLRKTKGTLCACSPEESK